MTKTLILDHIKNYLKIRHDKDFALYLGIKQNTLSAWKSRDVIDYELVMEKCPFLNGDWLLRNGEGEMLREEALRKINSISEGEIIKAEIRKLISDLKSEMNNTIKKSEEKLLAGMFSIHTLIEVLLEMNEEINIEDIKKAGELEDPKEYLKYLEKFEKS